MKKQAKIKIYINSHFCGNYGKCMRQIVKNNEDRKFKGIYKNVPLFIRVDDKTKKKLCINPQTFCQKKRPCFCFIFPFFE